MVEEQGGLERSDETEEKKTCLDVSTPTPPPPTQPTRLSALSNWRGRGADGCDERPVFDECVFQLAGERSARGDDELRQAGRRSATLSESREGTAGESPGGRKRGREEGGKSN